MNVINYKQAELIINKCDSIIENIDVDKIVNLDHGCYSNYISALIVKIVLFYGLKNDTVRKLKIDDYDEQLNQLTINHYRVRLPDGLAMQMKKYKEIRKRFLEKYEIKNERLFFDDYDPDKELDNTKMFIVLKKVMGNVQAVKVAKYSIIQMLKNGVPSHLIMDFTGNKKDILEECEKIVNKYNNMESHESKVKLLDSALIKIANKYERMEII